MMTHTYSSFMVTLSKRRLLNDLGDVLGFTQQEFLEPVKDYLPYYITLLIQIILPCPSPDDTLLQNHPQEAPCKPTSPHSRTG
jgi:hypothetical protein